MAQVKDAYGSKDTEEFLIVGHSYAPRSGIVSVFSSLYRKKKKKVSGRRNFSCQFEP